jgi:hypothetical protein
MLVSMLFAPLFFLANFVAAQEAQIPLQHHESRQSSTPSTLRVAIIGKLFHFLRRLNRIAWDLRQTERILQAPEQPGHLPHTTFAITRISILKLPLSRSTLPSLRPHPVLAAAPPQSMLSTTHGILPSLAQASSSK